MREPKFIAQPTPYLCGQACIAMLAGVSVDEVVEVIGTDKGTGKKDLERALKHYGIPQAKTMTKADNSTALPKCCLLQVLLPGYGHWVLYWKGKYYDPEFGLLEERHPKEKVRAYLEIFLDDVHAPTP